MNADGNADRDRKINMKPVSGTGGKGQASRNNYKSMITTVRTVSGLSKSLADGGGNGRDKFQKSGRFTSACGLGWHNKRRVQSQSLLQMSAADKAWTRNKIKKGMWSNDDERYTTIADRPIVVTLVQTPI